MKILHVVAGNLFGGVETMLATMARERDQCPELQQEFALCFAGRLEQELGGLGVPVHALGSVSARRPWQVMRARRRLQEVARTRQIEVVLAHGCWPYAIAAPAARAAGTRLALYLHDRVRGAHWVERWAARHTPDALIANSSFTRTSAVALFPGLAVDVVHPPVSVPPLAAPDVRVRLRAELGAASDETVVLIASRLERWKGHLLLIDALSRLSQRQGWRCWVAGGPQRSHEVAYLAELHARTKDAGLADRVTFLGQRSDVWELLASVDILCQPNQGPEPFGVTFVEALAAGVPVITTAQGGALEVVDATCGLLVLPGDVAALSAAINDLIGAPDRALALGSAGPSRAAALCAPGPQLGRLHAALVPPLVAPPTPMPEAPRWVELLGSLARALPRGRYAVPDLACRVSARVGVLPGAFLGRVEVPGGTARFVCDLRDKNCREVYFAHRHESRERALIAALLSAGDTFVDVGANWGYLTLVAAAAVGARGRVIAIEPDPRMFSLLQRNVALNLLEQVVSLQVAASDAEGSLDLVGFDETGKAFGVSARTTGAPTERGHVFRVRACPLDAALDDAGVERIALVRMDVDGAEVLALQGMRHGLARGRYTRLLLELHPRALAEVGTTPDQVCEPLRAAGYTGWSIDHSAATTRRVAYSARVDPAGLLRPLQPDVALDACPHQLWVAPQARPLERT